MGKRKTSALRTTERDTRYTKNNKSFMTFYSKENNLIDLGAARAQKQRRQVQLIPKSQNQEKFILKLLDPDTDIIVVTGPAGTGKTYLTMLAAISALRNGECQRIILTRPAVSVDDEKHGFLPGDLNAKLEPWVKPMMDVFREFYSQAELSHMLEEQIIEIAPLAYCRGRNFKQSWVILDEAQNATPSQMKMLLTRIGEGSKMVLCGDIEQADRKLTENGLNDLKLKLKKSPIDGIAACEFDVADVQRHRLISSILNIYG